MVENSIQKIINYKKVKEPHWFKAINETLILLESNNFSWISNLGIGGFGIVVEVENKSTREKFAAKITLEDKIKDSERKMWSSLSHENILPVIDIFSLAEPQTWVFLMPKQKTSLDVILKTSTLQSDENGLQRSLFWLQGILEGVSYLHQQKLCHLDFKDSNILINDLDKAVIADFGSLTCTDAGVNSYVSPFVYRSPEAL